ncbi:ammonium transmembrane transporter [Balamuthia mandrillaris]
MSSAGSEDAVAALASDLDTIWVLVAGTLVFFMQAGFALLEAGSIQQKNVTNILLKNLADAAFGGLVFYLVGFGFAFGDEDDNEFIGDRYFALSGIDDDDSTQSYIYFFFQFTFAATAATIVSGCVAERCRMKAYLIYTSAISGFIYPVVVHWCWSSTGWLSAFKADGDYFVSDVGLIDFAGSGVVHMVGGGCGLMGAIIIGPRLGRFDKGKWFTGKIHGHNIAYSALGTFILWTGWYGFNPGSTLMASGGFSAVAARSAVTTTVSACAGAVFTLFISIMWSAVMDKALLMDLSTALNGALAGLIGITAGCSVVQPWAALVIGIISAFVYFFSSKLLELLRIDDPVDASPLHFFCGAWGVIAVGFFASEDHVAEVYRESDDYGVFVGSSSGKQLGVQIVAVIVIALWSCSLSGILFFALRVLGFLRVSHTVEIAGLDEDHHGGSGYDMKGRGGSVIKRTPAGALACNSALEDKVFGKLDSLFRKKEEDEGVEMQNRGEAAEASSDDEENPRQAMNARVREGSIIRGGAL